MIWFLAPGSNSSAVQLSLCVLIPCSFRQFVIYNITISTSGEKPNYRATHKASPFATITEVEGDFTPADPKM